MIQFLLILCLSCTDKEHESVTTQERLPKTTIINKNNEIFSAFPSVEIFNGTYKARFFTRLNSSHIDTLGGEVIKYSLDSGNNWFIKSEQIVNGIKGFKKPFFNTYPIGWKYIDKIHKDSLLNEGFTVSDSSSNLWDTLLVLLNWIQEIYYVHMVIEMNQLVSEPRSVKIMV